MKGVEYFMKLPDQLKDIVYRLLQEPTLDNFRNFLKGQTGEHNSIDFKEKWIEPTKLVKEMLAIANSGGGIIIFGVKEKEDKSFSYDGIEEIVDKAKISNDIKNYISTELKYEVYDFVYDSSEYEKLQNHKYQMMVIKDCPRFIPFMSMKESTNLKKNRIYIRRGTSCEEATSEGITDIIKRRMNAEYPDSGKTLNLDEHLEQLKTLYSKISPTNEYYQGGIGNSLLKLTEVIKAVSAGEWISEDTGVKSRDILAEQSGESRETIRRYIRLTELIPEILEMVDDKKISMRPAVELSYLPKEEQEILYDTMESEACTPSHAQAIKIRKFSAEGRLNEDVLLSIMSEEKPNQVEQWKIPKNRLKKYFPSGTTQQKMEETIIKALELYRKREKSRER